MSDDRMQERLVGLLGLCLFGGLPLGVVGYSLGWIVDPAFFLLCIPLAAFLGVAIVIALRACVVVFTTGLVDALRESWAMVRGQQ